MKALFWVGLTVLVLGVLSLFVPIPHRERNGLTVGGVTVGITAQHDANVSPVVSAVMIVLGAGMLTAVRSREA
jgi:hypothetical protein